MGRHCARAAGTYVAVDCMHLSCRAKSLLRSRDCVQVEKVKAAVDKAKSLRPDLYLEGTLTLSLTTNSSSLILLHCG